ncbi:PilT/PilU family type 4a pilus ATPase [Lentisphaerota bacterium ZTH]|nr:PilT/PilU family type 4a pilus ATPase [Lentisphaerota bacterium]WET06246.1 PilT/PilU family type 4a pilus ATPase [Lentisphaerota bacterium ZTH]
MAKTLLGNVLEKAVTSDASDVHIKEGSPVAFRIDGDIITSDYIPDAEMLERFMRQVASDKQVESFHKTGDLDISHYEDGIGRFRINVHRQRGLICLNARWVKNRIMTFEQLGLPSIMCQISEYPRGIVILTGTTGSGKSTTLAAMLEHVNQTMAKHIITIEDPIEYEFQDDVSFFEQREVGIDTISFASALKHSLRQDPDIIMVGEMRDKTSFEAALQAADTGHLVMTTLHASNAAQTINRILDFYEKAEQDPIREALANNLAAVISQRLLPRAMGSGRVPANEIMINSPIITKLLQENRLDKLSGAVAAGNSYGMMTFNQCLLKHVDDGLISEEDALEASDNPEALKMNFEGIFLSAGDSKILG